MPGRPKGSKNGDVEQRWYDSFCELPADERAAALRILEMNHRAILVAEKARQPKRPSEPDAPPPELPFDVGKFKAASSGDGQSGELDVASGEEVAEASKK